MTEQEAMNEVQEAVMKRRQLIGIADHSYCSKCHKEYARYLSVSLLDGSTECEECYAKRIYDSVKGQITESDSSEIKAERAQVVKQYFQVRRKKVRSKLIYI